MRDGTLFTVEAFVASLLVLSTLFFLYSDPVQLPDFKGRGVEENLDNCLMELEMYSEIGEVNISEREAVEDQISECLPGFVDYELVFCEGSCGVEKRDRDVLSSRRFSVDKNEPRELMLYGWSDEE